MSDATATDASNTDTTDATDVDNSTGSETEPDWKVEAEKWKSLSRKYEQRSKENADKASEFDKLTEANKSEQQRLEERAAAAEARLPNLEVENMRLRVGLVKGVPAALIDRLQGATQEEIEKDADDLIAQFGQVQQQQATPDLRPGAAQRPVGAQQQTADDWIRGQARR